MRRPQSNANSPWPEGSGSDPALHRQRPHEHSTRSAAALVLVIAVVLAAVGSRTVSLGSPVAPATPTEADVAEIPSSDPTFIAIVPTTSPTVPVVPPTATPTQPPTLEPTLAPSPTPTEAERPTVPPSGNATESVVVERGDPQKLQVAFTFDAGEGEGYVPQILDLFKQYGIHGTFGVTGAWAEQHPDLVKRMVDEGHLVINHTESHQSFTGFSTGAPALTDEERTAQIVQANDAIVAASGQDTRPFFRFPYNDYDEQSLILLKQLGYDYTMGYTCDTLAWDGNVAADIEERCGPDAEGGGPGAILLMHVVQEQDFIALEPLIQAYLAAGYQIVTIDAMIAP